MSLWVLGAAAAVVLGHLALALGLIRNWLRDRRATHAQYAEPPQAKPRSAGRRVSVVVVVKDEEHGLPLLLQSLKAQTHPEMELIFVDDGSSDGTEAILRRFEEQHPDRVVVLSGRDDAGALSPKQQRLDEGVAASRGDVVLFTDGDCTVLPSWVEDTLGYFADDSVGLVFGQLSVRGEGGVLKAFQAFDLPVFQHFAAGCAGLGMPTGGCGNNLAVRRSALDEVGGFAGLGYTLTEDTALVSAVRKQGWKVRASTLRSTTTTTAPEQTLKGLYHQRLRWIGGLWHATDWATRWAVRVYGASSVAAVVALLLSVAAPQLLLWPAAMLLGVVLVAVAGAAVQHRHSLAWLLSAVPLASGFIFWQALTAAQLSVTNMSPVWKGRMLGLVRRDGRGADSGTARRLSPVSPCPATRREAFVEGLRTGAWALSISSLALLPSRWVLADRALDAGTDRWQAFALGLVSDAEVVVLPVSILVALILLARKRSRLWGQVAMSVVALGLWAFMLSATESSLSRGVFPSWVDVGGRWQSPDIVRGSFEMLFLARNAMPTLLMLVVGIVLLRSWPRPRMGRRASKSAGALVGGASLFLVAQGVASIAEQVPSTPLEIFTVDAIPEALACLQGPCEPGRLVEGHESSAPSTERGASILGWPAPAAEGPHPFARDLPSVEVDEAKPSAATRVLRQLSALSGELLGASHEPIHVWQIALEGMRGDDVHGVNPAAPRDAAPFLAELYDQAAAGAVGVFASRRTWTAGVRTPHGVAALTCGLGTLPYRLSLARDLPSARLRCLPDLLADAGFSGGYAYGGSTAFDRLGDFMAKHALAPRVTRMTLPDDVPQGAWGASDRAVFAAAAAAVSSRRPSYNLVLSLSHHHPFPEPEDTPAALLTRVERTFSTATDRADRTDRQRLLTLGYTDEALRELFSALSRRGILDRSIIAITADHSIPDRGLWRHRPSALRLHETHALIPFILWVSPKLFEGARNPDRARELAADVGKGLSDMPLSQNDIPTLMLALLERYPPIDGLGPDAAWHSMGGQATSPWYRAPGPSATRIHGIHAATALFFVDADGNPTAPDEPAPLVLTAARARAVTPSLSPAVSALRALPTDPR